MKMIREEAFKREYSYIQNPRYRENAKKLVMFLPDYFFEVAASSTGKYHPSFSLGEGGLVRHTKAAIRIAYELLQDESIGNVFNQDEKDLILIALLVHDGFKHGIEKSQYVLFDHPLIASHYIEKHKEELNFTNGEIRLLTNMIESHMGPWNTSNYSDTILPKPSNKYQKFVHMCDFLSSKKFLNITFKDNDIVE